MNKEKKPKLVIEESGLFIKIGNKRCGITYDACRRGEDRFYKVHSPNTIWNLKNALKIAKQGRKKQ